MNLDDLSNPTIRKLNPHLFQRGLPGSELKRPPGPTPLDFKQGETPRSARPKVRIVARRHRLLDFDNLAGGTKYITDALRYSGLINNDSAKDVELQISQEQIPQAEPQTTEIEIIFP